MITNVLGFLAKHNVPVYKKDRKEAKIRCLNPDHNDKNPSCFINIKTGQFYCFSCGFGGGIKKLESLFNDSTLSASDIYAGKTAIDEEEEIYKPRIVGQTLPVWESEDKQFFESIGGTEELAKTFNIQAVKSHAVLTNTSVKDSNIITIQHRIITPITKDGEIINYECRTTNGSEPKVLYAKACAMNSLFNYENIDFNKPVILTESIKNLYKIWQVNHNVIAMFHAIPTDEQLEMLSKIKTLIFFADYDGGSLGKFYTDKSGTEHFKDGGIQKLIQEYKGDLYACCQKIKYQKGDKVKGYDANDCSLEEIKHLIARPRPAENVEAEIKVNDHITW